MAETFWNSSGSDVWNSAANWTAGVPGVADVAIFDGRSSVSVGGADRSAGGLLTRIRIHRRYQGNIGSPGNPLIIPTYALDHLGSGSVHINLSANNLCHAQVDSKHAMHEDALHWTGFEPSTLVVLRGRVTNSAVGVGGATVFTVAGGRLRIPAIAGNAASIGWIFQTGGSVDVDRKTSHLTVAGGVMTIAGALADNTAAILNQSGGTVKVLYDIPITNAWILGGAFDIEDCTSAFACALMTVMPGADFRFNQESYSGITDLLDLRGDFP